MKAIIKLKTLTSLLIFLFILVLNQNTYSVSLGITISNLLNSSSLSVLPVPNKVKIGNGTFVITKTTKICVDSSSKSTGEFLANQLFSSTGFKIKVELIKNPTTVNDAISITTNSKNDLGDEGYELSVTENSVMISSLTKSGGFYGIQTLLQLLPTEVYSIQPIVGVTWTIPCVQIEDKPRFKWRGMMLDVSRHFFTKTEVMKVIDGMTINKLNTLQMHLVDADGWRIEIKRYPKLTEVGAWRDGISFGLDPESSTAYRADGKYGGFYTQDDIRELVSYAAERHINIVPEIEMPAHCSSAILSYPELKCTTKIQNPNVWEWPYCAGEDHTFEFLNNVLTEVASLFPGKYIHVGGDEVVYTDWKNCPKCQARIKSEGLKDEKELQSYFITRIEKHVNALGKIMIGWSEIMEAGIAKNTVLMDWIGGAEQAAIAGHDVVMTPHKYCYFDHRQAAEIQTEPKAHPRFLPLSRVYDFEPIPAKLDPVFSKHILGAQGNLWTEYIPNLKHLEYMAYPRLSALAEVTWSSKEKKDWNDFNRRLKTQFLRFDQLGINYRIETAIEIGEWTPKELNSSKPLSWELPQLTEAGSYRVSFDFVGGDHPIKIDWVALFEDGIELTRDNHNGIAGYEIGNDMQSNSTYVLKFPPLKAGSNYSLQALVTGDGGNDSHGKVNIQFLQNDIDLQNTN